MYKQLTEMSSEEFDTEIDYMENLPASMFFQALENLFCAEAQNTEETIVLHGQVVGSQLQLELPVVESREYVIVRDNEILVDNLRLVITLV